MPTVTIEGIGTATCDSGRRLVLCIEDAGVDILHRCGGNARCATCRVEVLAGAPSERTDAERRRLGQMAAPTPHTRLACQIQVRDDLSVRVLRRLRDHPEMTDPGPRPREWPADHPLPPDET